MYNGNKEAFRYYWIDYIRFGFDYCSYDSRIQKSKFASFQELDVRYMTNMVFFI